VSKAFTKESEQDEDGPEDDAREGLNTLPPGTKNYITPAGLQRLKDELQFLLRKERPAVTAVVSWAAGNGDRSENADYQYGKRRLKDIDRRIRFLTRRVDLAEVIDPATPRDERTARQAFFGATVRYANAAGEEQLVTIVGVDESDHRRKHISWISPLARTLMKARPGDTVILQAPGGTEELEVIDVRYERVDVEPFVPIG
jgi:transcription elongation factor GreB